MWNGVQCFGDGRSQGLQSDHEVTLQVQGVIMDTCENYTLIASFNFLAHQAPKHIILRTQPNPTPVMELHTRFPLVVHLIVGTI